jgi:hypothetical protein
MDLSPQIKSKTQRIRYVSIPLVKLYQNESSINILDAPPTQGWVLCEKVKEGLSREPVGVSSKL